jgi:hypothetical protein
MTRVHAMDFGRFQPPFHKLVACPLPQNLRKKCLSAAIAACVPDLRQQQHREI